MNKRPLLSSNWFLIACSLVIAIITAPAAQAIEPRHFDKTDDFSPRTGLHLKGASFEPVGRLVSVEDPPDLLRTAVVPAAANGQAASSNGFGSAPLWNGNGGFAPPVAAPNLNPSPFNGGTIPGGYGPTAPRNGTIPQNGFSNPGYGPAAPFGGYQPQPQGPAYQPAKPTDEELHTAKVTARYQDSAFLSFLSRSNMSQITSLYMEASNLIDTRHVSPTSYEMRTQSAVRGLMAALANPAFQRANNAAPRPEQLQAFQNDLSQILNSQGPRTAAEAVGVMQWAASMGSQRLGLRQEVVAMEFLSETLDSLDKYSSFMPEKTAMAPSAALETTAALEESIVGIGIELKTHEQGALIMGTIENGPSAEVGLKKGDILVSVNGQELAGMPLSQVADRITGRAGTSVVINIRRNGQRFAATLVRRSVYVSSVAGVQMLDNRVGYVRLKQFSESSTKDLEAAMMKLHNSGMQALVLDLRGNPGGLLTQSVTVSDLFLPQGTIVSTRGRNESDNSTEAAKFDRTWSTPLVVLVDDNSASASEIFAAAVQDNRRAVLVGRKSYGKGTVQTHFPLKSAGGTLKLTTAKFYAPSGREMAGQGVTPEFVVNQPNMDLASTLTEDADVLAALQVIQSGVPTQLAQGSPVSQYGNQAGVPQQQPVGGLPNYGQQLAPIWNGQTGYQMAPGR